MLICEEGKGFQTKLNDGKGNFINHSNLVEEGLGSVLTVFKDLDNDNDLDAVITNWSWNKNISTKLLINDGSGKFKMHDQQLSDLVIGRSAVGDLNNDGLQDIVLSSLRQFKEIWLNKGNNKFEKSELKLQKNNAYTNPVICDIDDDKDMDLFFSNFLGGSNELWFNKLN